MKTYFLKYAAIVCALFFTTLGCERQKISSETEDEPSISSVVKESGTDETDFYYTETGEKEFLNIRKDKVIIKTESVENAKALCSQPVFISAYNVGFWVLATIDPSKTNPDNWLEMQGVIDATYGLEYVDGTLQYPDGIITLKCKGGNSPEEVLEAAGLRKSIETIELFDTWSNSYHITLNVKLDNILRISRDLYESGLYEFAQPNFFLQVKLPME